MDGNGGTELANRSDSFLEMEKRDEEQILSELQGGVLKEMFYVSKEGKAVVSWIGIKEIARKYGGIDVNLVEKTDLGEQWLVIVKATDKNNGYSLLGASTQAKMMDVYDRDPNDPKKRLDTTHKEPDPFVLPKAMSKAQRNAIRALVPETFFAQMVDTWRKGPKPAAPAPRPQAQSSTAYSKPPAREAPRVVDSKPKVKDESPPAFVNAAELPKVPDDFRYSEEAAHIADYIVENFEQQFETVRALIWREMNKAEPHLLDVEAAKSIQEDFENKRKPMANADVTEADVVYQALQDQALDGEMIEVVEPGKLMPRLKRGSQDKREFLGDRWKDYDIVIASLGYQWKPDKANSAWWKKA
jgi:hypothetical protein